MNSLMKNTRESFAKDFEELCKKLPLQNIYLSLYKLVCKVNKILESDIKLLPTQVEMHSFNLEDYEIVEKNLHEFESCVERINALDKRYNLTSHSTLYIKKVKKVFFEKTGDSRLIEKLIEKLVNNKLTGDNISLIASLSKNKNLLPEHFVSIINSVRYQYKLPFTIKQNLISNPSCPSTVRLLLETI